MNTICPQFAGSNWSTYSDVGRRNSAQLTAISCYRSCTYKQNARIEKFYLTTWRKLRMFEPYSKRIHFHNGDGHDNSERNIRNNNSQ